MGEAFITRRGGISKAVAGGVGYAAICATYPAGWVCTCSDGTTTLKATDTTGKIVFAVPSAGTWTVTATDGTQTSTKTVSITTANQSETVTVSAPSTGGAVLYNAGTVGTGYTLSVYGGATKGSKSITTAYTSGNSAIVIKPSSGTIDLSQYSALKVTMKYTLAYNELTFGVGASTSSASLGSFTASAKATYTDSGLSSKTYTLNLTSQTGTVACVKLGGANIGVEVTKIEFV